VAQRGTAQMTFLSCDYDKLTEKKPKRG